MAKTHAATRNNPGALLKLNDVSIKTPGGRPLFDRLNMVLGNEQVAIFGRNGVGKTTLLRTIAGDHHPDSGIIRVFTHPYVVRQHLSGDDLNLSQAFMDLGSDRYFVKEKESLNLGSYSAGSDLTQLSSGQLRKLSLLAAKHRKPALLLLDEPTEDLDESGVRWLSSWLPTWKGGLMVVSHDRLLLSLFGHFIWVSETGCRYFKGSFEALCTTLHREGERIEKSYASMLKRLTAHEERRAKILKRRQRKKNYGRISELKRCTPKQRLNKKRSLAQVNQGKSAKVSLGRILAARNRAIASRRELNVNFPINLDAPHRCTSGFVSLSDVSDGWGGRLLFRHLNLTIGFDRCAITGPNGAGKSTLLKLITGDRQPSEGQITMHGSFGVIAQAGENWMREESLLDLLLSSTVLQNTDEVAQVLLQHKFPIALANRPLRSLSPGERVRASLISLFQASPPVHMLILDEPTYSLDAEGEHALKSALSDWPGGLIVASHNQDFLSSLNPTKRLVLHGDGRHTLVEEVVP